MDRRLIWLGVGAFATSTVAFVFAGLLPLIAAGTGLTVAGAGTLIAAYSLSYAIGTPILSALAGAMDRRRLIALALVAFLAGNTAAAASASYGMLMAAQIVMGAAAGLFAGTAQATAVALAGAEHRARAVAMVMGGNTFAVALGAPFASLIANLAGWRFAFITVAALALLCLTILWVVLPRGIAGLKLTLKERIGIVARPGVAASLAITFLYIGGAFVIISYLAPLAIEGAGLDVSTMPVVLLAFGIGAVAGNAASGRLTDRLGANRVVAAGMLACSAICLVVWVVVAATPDRFAGPALIALMVPWGIAGWTFPPAQASRLVAQAPEVSHLTLPLNVSAMYFGVAFGTFLGGYVLQALPPAELALVAAPFPLAGLAVMLASERRPRPLPSIG